VLLKLRGPLKCLSTVFVYLSRYIEAKKISENKLLIKVKIYRD